VDTTTKRILIVGCAGLLLLAALGIAVGWLAWRRLAEPMLSSQLDTPAGMETASVRTGSGFLSRSVLVEDAQIGSVTDIAVGELDPSPGREIGIAGSGGALFLDEAANVKSSVALGDRAAHVDIVDVEADGVCEFMNRGHWGCDASLFDHSGKTIWTYGGSPGVDDMAAGDLDGDGALEFVVGFNGGGGVHLLESDGSKQWRQPDGNVWHVEMVDADGDGRLEVVHSNAGGEIKVLDAAGKTVKQGKPAPYFSDFSLCRWPGKQDREYALLAEDDTIWLFDFDGNSVHKVSAPECGTLGHARGVPVKLKGMEPEYFAVVVEFSRWQRSILYVFAPDGKLVYQEVLPEACGSIAAMSVGKGATESILVGAEGKVWQFDATDSG
jgi:hypothetical protein